MIDSPSNNNELASPLSINNSQQQTIPSPQASKSPNFKLPATQFAPTLSRPSGII